MILDIDKLKSLRSAKGYSQEKLAALCDVNKRTIQRAELGLPVAMETVAFIAEALQTTPANIRGSVNSEAVSAEAGAVVLVPMNSGRRIIDLLRTSFANQLRFEVEPTQANVEALSQLAGILERFNSDPWEMPTVGGPTPYSEILRAQAEVNALLDQLSPLGVTVFAATYSSRQQIPQYDMDEGHMYVSKRAPYEPVTLGIVVVSDAVATHLVTKPSDLALDFDDIPF